MLRDGPSPDAPSFRFRLVGPFALERDGEALPDRAVGSRKGRTLLKLLLVERGHLVSTDRIVEALWGDAPPGKPEENVAALVSRLRAVVGAEAIGGGRGGYRILPGARHRVDADEAEELTREAEARLRAGEPSLARVAAEGALRILDAGALLEDEPYTPWCEEARAELERVHRRARRAAWEAALQLSDHGWAAQVAGAAIGADPFDEEAYRALMAAHRQAAEPSAALAAYERLRGGLADGLGVDPSPETESLYLSILRAEPVSDVPAPSRSAPARERSPDPGFVGREHELAWLSERWSDAAVGKPTLVLICGEAGIGKTSLAAEVDRLATRTGGTAVLTRCYEAERSLFLQPIVEAIRSIVIAMPPDDVRRLAGPWAGTLAELVPEVARVLRPHGYQPSSPEIERRRSFDALSGFLRHLARERPLLLIVDDLHNAGTSTVEALHFLFRQSNVDRLLALATARADEGAEAIAALGGIADRLDLGPLSDGDVADLAERMGAGELAARIQAMARGHPMFVVETLRLVAEGSGSLDTVRVPESLRAAVESRAQRAGAEVDEFLRGAATLGSAFELHVAAELLDLSLQDAARRAERALRARLLVDAGASFEFANDLIREVLYATTPVPTRMARHRRAMSLVTDPEAIAVHAAAAGDRARAVEAWLEAADRAARRFAMRDAERLLDLALEAAREIGDPAVEARARMARGSAREVLADYAGAYEDHRTAVELARETGERAVEMQSLTALGGDIWIGRGGRTEDCTPYLEAALSIAQEIGDGPAEVRILGRLCIVRGNQLRFDVANDLATRALAKARALGDERAVSVALDGLKMVAAYTGDIAALESLVAEIEGNLRRRGDLWYLQWTLMEAAFVPLARAAWDDAVAKLDEVVAISRRIGDPGTEVFALEYLCWIERARGSHGEALARGREAVALAEVLGHPWWVAFGETMRSWALIETGSVHEAVAGLERGLEAAERDGAENFLVRVVAHLAWAAQLAGDHERARAMIERAEGILAAATAPPGVAFLHGGHAIVALARAELLAGDAAAPERLLAPVVAAARTAGWQEVLADASLVLGLGRLAGADPGAAETPLTEALTVARAHGMPRIELEAAEALAGLVAPS